MHGPVSRLFLLFMLVTASPDRRLERRQLEQLPVELPETSDKPPSCTELRAMWVRMRRMARHSEATNEIPLIPRDFLGYMLGIAHLSPYSGTSRRQHPSSQLYPWPAKAMSVPDRFNSFQGVADKAGQGKHPSVSKDHLKIPINEGNSNVISFAADHGPDRLFHLSPSRHHQPIHHYPPSIQDPSSSLGFFGGFEDVPASSHPSTHIRSSDVLTDDTSLPLLFADDSTMEDFGSTSRSSHDTFGEPFSGNPLEEELLGLFGTVVHNAAEKEQLSSNQMDSFAPLPQWGPNGEVGIFGEFSPDEESRASVTRHETRTRTPSGQGLISDPEETETLGDILERQLTCAERSNQPCQNEAHCSCIGWSQLRCTAGRCHSEKRHHQTPLDNDWGLWMNGPLPSSHLGLSRRRRAGIKTTLM